MCLASIRSIVLEEKREPKSSFPVRDPDHLGNRHDLEHRRERWRVEALAPSNSAGRKRLQKEHAHDHQGGADEILE